MRIRKPISLRYSILAFSVFSVIPLILLMIYSSISYNIGNLKETRKNLELSAQLIAREKAIIIEGTDYLLTALSKLPEVQNLDFDKTNDLFKELTSQYIQYQNIAVADLQGNLIISSTPLPQSINIGDREYFKKALEKKEFVAGIFQISRINFQPQLMFAKPVYRADRIVSILVAALDINWLNEQILSLDLPDNSTLVFVDSKGTIIAHYPNPEGNIGNPFKAFPYLEKILESNDEGSISVRGQDKIKRLYSYSPLISKASSKIVLFLSIPMKQLYSAARKTLYISIFSLIVISSLIILFSWKMVNLFQKNYILPLVSITNQIAKGDFKARFLFKNPQVNIYKEMTDLVGSTNSMAAALERAEIEKQDHIARLKSSEDSYKKLSQSLQKNIEGERKRIAREIHDDLGQDFTLLLLQLDKIRENFNKTEQRLHISFAREIVEEMIRKVQNLAQYLRPVILDQFGLAAALEWHMDKFQKKTGILCKKGKFDESIVLDEEKKISLYRIYQESLTNAAKHSKASEIEINLFKEKEEIVLSLKDNGTGIPPDKNLMEDCMGFISIKERVNIFRGTFNIFSKPSHGTELIIKIPEK